LLRSVVTVALEVGVVVDGLFRLQRFRVALETLPWCRHHKEITVVQVLDLATPEKTTKVVVVAEQAP
jgi:hypothetical protein